VVHQPWQHYWSVQVKLNHIPGAYTVVWRMRINLCRFVLMFHSTLTTEVTPSFILLAIQGSKVVTYVYELHGDQVDVSKSEFSKA
jgi:hypothetical protein